MRILPLLCLVLASCSVQAKLVLQPDGGAVASADFQLSKQARDAWSSLRDLDSTLPADPLDQAFLRAALGKTATLKDSSISGWNIVDLKRFVPTWKVEGDVWEGSIDRAVVRRWIAATAWSDSPAVDSMIPAPGTAVTEAEYRDLLVYLLGSAPGAKTLVEASTVQLTLVAPRPLRSAPGAVSVSDRTAVYRWPLVKILTLESPLQVRLVF